MFARTSNKKFDRFINRLFDSLCVPEEVFLGCVFLIFSHPIMFLVLILIFLIQKISCPNYTLRLLRNSTVFNIVQQYRPNLYNFCTHLGIKLEETLIITLEKIVCYCYFNCSFVITPLCWPINACGKQLYTPSAENPLPYKSELRK